MVGNTREDVKNLVALEQSQGDRFYSSLLTFDHYMNLMSNWTTSELNGVKSALSVLTSNHEKVGNDIAGMRNVIKLLGKSINEQMEISDKSVNLNLDNSINMTLHVNDALNARLDDIKGDINSIQTTMDMMNISMAEQAVSFNEFVNESIETAINTITNKVSEAIDARLGNVTNRRDINSIHTTIRNIDTLIKDMNEVVNAQLNNVNDQLTNVSNIVTITKESKSRQTEPIFGPCMRNINLDSGMTAEQAMFSTIESYMYITCSPSASGWLPILRLVGGTLIFEGVKLKPLNI